MSLGLKCRFLMDEEPVIAAVSKPDARDTERRDLEMVTVSLLKKNDPSFSGFLAKTLAEVLLFKTSLVALALSIFFSLTRSL